VQTDLGQAMPRYTQGLMDLGATVCTARSPSCLLCPLQSRCVARHEGRMQDYPVKTRKLKRSRADWWLLWAEDAEGRVFIARRPSTGIWSGLHCLPVFEDEDALLAALPAGARAQVQPQPPFTHVLTHKDLLLHPVYVQLSQGDLPREGQWLLPGELAGIGLPAPVKKLLSPISGLVPAP